MRSMGVSELEVSNLNLTPLSPIGGQKNAKVVSSWEWKQLPREKQKKCDLVVSPAATSDLLVHQVRVIDDRIILLKKAKVDLATGSGSLDSKSVERKGDPHAAGRSNSKRASSKRYSDEELLEELQRLRVELGHPPTANEISEYGMCSYVTISERFGGLKKAREQAGVGQPAGQPSNKISEQDLIKEIKRVSEKVGRVPSHKDIEKHAKYSTSAIWNAFGGIQNAIVEAGLRSPPSEGPTIDDWKEYRSRNQVQTDDAPGYTEEELLRELQVLAKSLGRSPKVKDIKEHSKYSYKPYRNRWASISEARKAAGVEEYKPSEERTE